jgi:glycosyltransferase involved in cell wall biosynthesis
MEVLLVDDASSDDTVECAKAQLRSSGLNGRVLQHRQNKGPAAARNTGWRQAKGKWIQFLDVDDTIDPDKISWQLEYALSADPSTAVVYSEWQELLEQGEDWRPGRVVCCVFEEESCASALLRGDNFLATGSYVIEKSWLQLVGGFDETRRFVEDVEMLIRLAIHGGCFQLAGAGRPLFFYRRNSESLSRSDRGEFIRGCVRNAEIVRTYLQEHGLMDAQNWRPIADVYVQAARYSAENDVSFFSTLLPSLSEMEILILPMLPARLRIPACVLGYGTTERMAAAYRQLKAGLSKKSTVSNANRFISQS